VIFSLTNLRQAPIKLLTRTTLMLLQAWFKLKRV